MNPRYLYKVFSEKVYAEQFINDGSVRFSTLRYFKSIEDDARVDSTEGHGRVSTVGESLVVNIKNKTITSIPGIENIHVDGGEKSSFIYCVSSPQSERLQDLPKKFGKYVVRIKDPDLFFEDVKNAMLNDKSLERNRPELKRALVRYDKGEHIKDLTEDEKEILGWSQKPGGYSNEFEYRYRFSFLHELIDSPDHYFITIGKKLSYSELITRMD